MSRELSHPKVEAAIGTPQLHLETVFVLDAAGRMVSTCEPQATPGPVFSLVRSGVGCVRAVRTDLSEIEFISATEDTIRRRSLAEANEHTVSVSVITSV